MDEQLPGIQLEMNFDTPSGTRFRRCLANGVFNILFEVTAPGNELPDEEAAARLAVLEKTVLNSKTIPCALAITDRYWSDKHRCAVDYAALLPEKNRNSHVVYLSGRNSDAENMRGMIAAAQSLNLANLVAVSGPSRHDETVRSLRKKNFTESVFTLQMLKNAGSQEEIEQQKKQMLNEVRQDISGLAVDIASKVIEREINQGDYDAFVDEFIRNVGDKT